jgi:hypothetical protein
MLVFPERYDTMWKANADGIEYKSLPLYSTINGFWIDKSGTFEVILEYSPQTWFIIGTYVTTITVVLSMLYISLRNYGVNISLNRFNRYKKIKHSIDNQIHSDVMMITRMANIRMDFLFLKESDAINKIGCNIKKYKDIPIIVSIALLCFAAIQQLFNNTNNVNELVLFTFYLSFIGILVNFVLLVKDEHKKIS